MLRAWKDIQSNKIDAKDGLIGSIKDLYFDDAHWTVRYLVADTGTWLPGRKVLISPYAVRCFQPFPSNIVEVELTRKQIEESPSIHSDEPVSRQFEERYHQYYGWPYYGFGPGLWGPVTGPAVLAMASPTRTPPAAHAEEQERPQGDPHLRSVREVTGYYVSAVDGNAGHIEDFVVDDESWTIRYLVVDTRNWLPGKKVLLSPAWSREVDWERKEVRVEVERHTIKSAPEYDPQKPISRDYEVELFYHYGQTPYWEKNLTPVPH